MEAELKFEKEHTSGIAVVGSYLIDAAKRLGIEIHDDCGRLGLCDTCAVTVKSGAEFLSEPTKAELEQLSDDRRKQGERLSCQAKIAKEGEIVIMTHEKKDPRPDEQRKHEEYRKEFEELPLEKKISRLMELEAVALSETLSYVMNAPYTIGGKVVDFLSDFGFKFEKEAKEAKKPDEHKEESKEPDAKKHQSKRGKKRAAENDIS
ncbi:MAG TPA: 2Fe-2S iron-sulfur cluster-binding protein [Pyrinomonadaceae bacterium]|jgi:ferredoxin|nr:2Fe-2S iron-sulfur cluster-binding protein [Pyrinomonadaceae bacterium]